MSLADDLRHAGDPVKWARAVLSFEPEEWQANLMRSTARQLILNCSRQSGKSETTAVLALHQAMFDPGLVLIASRSLRQSRELFSKLTTHLRRVEPVVELDEDNRLSCSLKNGARIVSLPGDAATVRGFSAPRLVILDEASQIPDEFYGAIRPMLSHGGRLMLLSSPFGRRGFFFEAWQNGGDRWQRFRVPATESKQISKEFLEQERKETSDFMFRQEYLCEFLDTTNQVFSYDLVMRALSDRDFAALLPHRTRPDRRRLMTITCERVRGHAVGLDLGQVNDFTAITVIERTDTMVDEVSTDKRYAIRHLQRIKLGTSYDEQVAIVARLMKALPRPHGSWRPRLIVDATGVGRPVCDLLKKAGLAPITVTITGGKTEADGGDFNYSIPKRNLVSSLQICFQNGKLKISKELPDAENLINELLNFRVTISNTAHDSYDAWRERLHDDLVLSTAMATWWLEREGKGARWASSGHMMR